MSTLVIIGNGFDIWNRLPTSYWYFYDQYNRSLEDHIQYFDDFCDEDAEWTNFEESLGSFNHDNFHDNAAWQPSLEEMADDHTLLYGFEDEISNKREELVDDITNAFKEWIGSVDVSVATRLIEFPSDFKFVNFNYTTTLQDVYGIHDDDILHIHGKVRRNIIFGHGRGASSTVNTSSRDEPWFEESQRSASSVSGVFHKPVDAILERNRAQLEGYGSVTDIFVIGHSVNDIDLPYFQCILNAYPNAEWKNFNYIDLDNDIDAVTETHHKLVRAGVPEHKLTSSSSEDLRMIFSMA
ncbi:bacteriophage abortive infection AbiH family protein [Aliivibrio sp. S4TY2]|uniref:bacteriophage abortive infection AbiH family protein n=1 Tax=unclassified Aliivibrio TaxID=2645654 RepID=UPI0023782A5A|nr:MULTISPECIES: bacteriophage abortive infection AbiH family protein [unclassified Aliivibrio]MDD9158023.1 bacteriophage abortive infection AbiH family protein [Aliivibrio sp. S4TY2]MDD9161934.1 bacteriophage abortive infection AbiH family protein [Aliivibrio sp. S4TY1]MDD9166020.1 bacteriophage abortive infection AbiH family protein [Aliivibrio sp. S4MY2]MDD9170014.1 bacteriophage abortive infection AbiH family protein [Aliivibrio sp. S4MY4]MDD9187065.1 bacteriophage abortive infection AbiH 